MHLPFDFKISIGAEALARWSMIGVIRMIEKNDGEDGKP
jgi:hypothetical protein